MWHFTGAIRIYGKYMAAFLQWCRTWTESSSQHDSCTRESLARIWYGLQVLLCINECSDEKRHLIHTSCLPFRLVFLHTLLQIYLVPKQTRREGVVEVNTWLFWRSFRWVDFFERYFGGLTFLTFYGRMMLPDFILWLRAYFRPLQALMANIN